ncbi:hypothetical protein IWZ00DRAFT_487687 [Phyllosticta capitalensis]|uniref:Uncharacterized protein n=1 Tax=Phyllosticta capitalensis TaxID=121624 RepID=A0ABR1YSF8_9PEZI
MAICLPAWLACLLACLLACPSLSGGPYPSLILSISPSSFGLRPSVSIPTQRPNGTKLRSSLSHLPRSSPLVCWRNGGARSGVRWPGKARQAGDVMMWMDDWISWWLGWQVGDE